MKISKWLLRIAAISSFLIAIFQAVISFVPSWSLYFGAPVELVANPPILIVSGVVAAIIFALFGLYALAGAGDITPLPLQRVGLLGIGGIYTFRGLLLIYQLLVIGGILQSDESFPPQMLISSFVSLVVGLLYLSGSLIGWRDIQPAKRSQAAT